LNLSIVGEEEVEEWGDEEEVSKKGGTGLNREGEAG
jgi:hypothetical protein